MFKFKITLCFLAMCFCLADQPVQASPESLIWPAARAYPMGDRASRLISADINNDGNADFVNGHSSSGNISILLGDSNGAYSLSGTPIQPIPAGVTGMIAADFNRDGNIDLAVTSSNFSRVYIYLGNGQGGLTQTSTTFLPGNALTNIAAADFNNDNNLDVVVTGNGSFLLLLGNGLGGLSAPVSYPVPAGVAYFTVADVNSDGRQDVVAAGGSSISVLLGNAAGGFGNPIVSSHGLFSGNELVTGDLNCDGALDAVVLEGGFRFAVLFGTGQGGFATPVIYNTGMSLQSISLGDINRDGEKDVVLVSNSGSVTPGNIIIYTGNMTGIFTPHDAVSVGMVRSPVFIKDVDGDKNPDFIFSQSSLNYDGFLNVLLGDGVGSFSNYIPFGFTPNTFALRGVVSADFNNDNLDDFAVTRNVSFGFSRVSVYLNNGQGQFGAPTDIILPGISPGVLENGDINRDGIQDLIVGSANSTPGTTTVLIGNGNGTFNVTGTFNTPNEPISIKAADFNNDQNLDVIVRYFQSPGDAVTVFLGNGLGGFTGAGNYNFGSTGDWAVADFNQDGNKDWVITSSNNRNFGVFLGNGQGGFTNLSNSFLLNGIYGVAAEDVTNDGQIDLVIGYERTVTTGVHTHQVRVFVGNNNGTFTQGNIYDVGEGPQVVLLRDFNRDGVRDIIVENHYSDNVSVLPGNGNGSFSPARHYGAVREVNKMVAGDFDSDGKLDLLTLSYSGEVGFLLNNSSNVYANISTNYNQLPPGATLLNTLKLNNVTAQMQTFHLVLVTVLPNNTVRPELFLPNFTMSANQSISVNYPWAIPQSTPLGVYSQQVWIGTSLNDIWDVGAMDYEVKYPVYCPAF